MAAISTVILSICNQGDNIISSKFLFGNTYSLFAKTLSALGIETRFTNLDNLEEMEKKIDGKTRAVFIEMLTNPQLIIFDIQKISALAAKHSLLLIVDNTILTPYIFKCADYGVDIEIASTTKFISGGATSIGGAVMIHNSNKWSSIPKLAPEFEKYGNQAMIKKLAREVYRNIGCCLSPNNAYLQLLGLETITLRIDRICDNALQIANYLQNHTKIEKLDYPSLESSNYYPLAKELFGLKSGPLINIELKSKSDCYRFMDRLKMIRRGTNFCDNKSMIIHPHSTIYCEFSEAEKEEMLVNSRMIRFSVGLEDVNDIIDDLEQALTII
jgi:O-acetylhomoserine (thiol)-lyase